MVLCLAFEFSVCSGALCVVCVVMMHLCLCLLRVVVWRVVV